jgi:hypothetical protein
VRTRRLTWNKHHRKLREIFAAPLPCLGNVLVPRKYSSHSYLHDYLLPPHDYLLPPTTASLRLSLMAVQNLGDFQKRHNKEKHLLVPTTVRSDQNRPHFADAEKLFLLFKYPWGLRFRRAMTESYAVPRAPSRFSSMR